MKPEELYWRTQAKAVNLWENIARRMSSTSTTTSLTSRTQWERPMGRWTRRFWVAGKIWRQPGFRKINNYKWNHDKPWITINLRIRLRYHTDLTALNLRIWQKLCNNALCCYPNVKWTLEIQARFVPLLPFSLSPIISIAKRCSYNSPAQRSNPSIPNPIHL